MRLSARWRPLVFTIIMALGMSVFMSAVITAINTGFGGAYALRVLRAFALAFPVALTATYAWTPVVNWLSDRLTGARG